MKRAICLLCLAACLVAGAPTVAAAENRGSIQIKLETGDMPVVNGAVTLYQVGIRTEDGYRIREGFGGGIIRQEDANSENFAQWLAETPGETGKTLLLDADGSTVFSELEEGLYMLVQTERIDGFYSIYPVLLPIPEGEDWDIRIHRALAPVVTELPQTGQSPIPFFGVLGMILSSGGLLLCAGKKRKPEIQDHHSRDMSGFYRKSIDK